MEISGIELAGAGASAGAYVWIDATYLKVRQNGRIVSVAVTIAVGVNSDGRREVLGMAIGASEAETFWTDFLRSLARRACAEALIAAIPADATIIAYNAPFEKGVLRELAALFPDLKAAMLSMAEQTVDLLPVTRNNWYHRDQRGSWSIKAVLPTMTSLDYNSLDVKDGTDAQQAYLKAIRPETTDEERSVLSAGLKTYCAQDTWAMVAMARFLSAAV